MLLSRLQICPLYIFGNYPPQTVPMHINIGVQGLIFDSGPTLFLLNIFFCASLSLRIQVCPKKGITPTFLFEGWDWNPQSYSREGSGFFGFLVLVRQVDRAR